MLDRLSVRQILDWLRYYGAEPFGDRRADLQSAIIAQTIASTVPRRGRAPQTKDFMVDWDRPPVKRQTEQEMRAQIAQIKRSMSKKRNASNCPLDS